MSKNHSERYETHLLLTFTLSYPYTYLYSSLKPPLQIPNKIAYRERRSGHLRTIQLTSVSDLSRLTLFSEEVIYSYLPSTLASPSFLPPLAQTPTSVVHGCFNLNQTVRYPRISGKSQCSGYSPTLENSQIHKLF